MFKISKSENVSKIFKISKIVHNIQNLQIVYNVQKMSTKIFEISKYKNLKNYPQCA